MTIQSVKTNDVGEIEGFIKSTLKQKPLIENSTINTEENKSEKWRLTKYP